MVGLLSSKRAAAQSAGHEGREPSLVALREASATDMATRFAELQIGAAGGADPRREDAGGSARGRAARRGRRARRGDEVAALVLAEEDRERRAVVELR